MTITPKEPVRGEVVAVKRIRLSATIHAMFGRSRYATVECVEVDGFDTRVKVDVGDKVWWDSGWVWWTPRDASRIDVGLPRVDQ